MAPRIRAGQPSIEVNVVTDGVWHAGEWRRERGVVVEDLVEGGLDDTLPSPEGKEAPLRWRDKRG